MSTRTGTAPRRCLSRQRSQSRPPIGSQAGAAAFDLKPDVGRSLVHSPAAGLGVDEIQPAAADGVELALADDVLEAGSLVDDLDHQPCVVEVSKHRHLALAVP